MTNENSKPVRIPPCPAVAKPFRSDDELLEAAILLFQARRQHLETQQKASITDKEERALRDQSAAWSRYWHESFRKTGTSSVICQKCRKNRLNKLEKEILVFSVLNHLGLLWADRWTTCDMFEMLGVSGKGTLAALRVISENGKLIKARLLIYDDPDEELAKRQLRPDDLLIEAALSRDSQVSRGRNIANELELYYALESLTRSFVDKSDAMKDFTRSRYNTDRVHKFDRKVEREFDQVRSTFELHPDWRLNTLCKGKCRRGSMLLLALLGKELGHVDADEKLFTGGGLARAVAPNPDGLWAARRLLTAGGVLVKENLIQPCGGLGEIASNNPSEIEQMEFELTEKAIGILELDKGVRRKRSGEYVARPAKIRMSQLVLSERVQRTLNMAVVHARHSHRIVNEWGLGEMIPYGHSPVLLFSGPPGTGKTATAEALANELGKPILVADYSRIQNCFVGQTEKNIVRVFREARSQDAVLFWDEADAMFFDRDSAHRNWEVRDVNVLLQEIERFEGVCILATNRKVSLDKALQRRITLRVDFDRPDQRLRQMIWRRMLPKKMPLSKDVNLNELSRESLVGGEIKNAVLNAARLALHRDEHAIVTMQDLREAVGMEQSCQWNSDHGTRIGFGR